MLKRLVLLLLPLTAFGQAEEWDNFDLTDGYGPGALISGAAASDPMDPLSQNIFRVGDGTFPADTSTFDVTWSGAGTPKGVIVFASGATTDNTTAAGAYLGCGVSDFTTAASVSTYMVDNVAATDGQRVHDTGNVIELHDEAGTIVRSATVATTTDGVRFTPNETGTAYKVLVIGVFDNAAFAFTDGDATADAGTFGVTHGLPSEPHGGVFCYSGVGPDATDGSAGQMSIGFFHDADAGGFIQRSAGFRFQQGQADGTPHAQLFTDRVAALVNNVGESFHEVEVTGNTATTTTFTARGAALTGDVVGLLFPADVNLIDLDTWDSPNATGAFTNTEPGFRAASTIVVGTQLTAVDTATTDVAGAGTMTVFATDLTDEYSVSVMDEQGAANSDTASRFSSELWIGNDDQTEAYACNTFAENALGFAATCDAANGTTHRWIALTIKSVTSSSGVSQILLRRRR